MGKFQLSEVVKWDLIKGAAMSFGKFYLAHESKFLTGGAVVSEAAAIAVVYKNSPQIHDILDETRYALTCVDESDAPAEQKKKDKKFLYGEAVKRLAPLVTPIAVFFGLSSYCAIKNEKNNEEHIAKLTAALALAQGTIQEYAQFRKEATQALGEKKIEKIDQTVTEERVKENPPVEKEVVSDMAGAVPMFDPYSNQMFYATMDRVNYACECMSNQLLACDEVDLTVYHDIIGVECTALDEAITWKAYVDGVKITPRKTRFDWKGVPCYKIELYPMPKGFERY